jgi:hypothetical protein
LLSFLEKNRYIHWVQIEGLQEFILIRKEQKSRVCRRRRILLSFLCVGLLIAWPDSIWAASVHLPKIQTVPGEMVEVPVNLEKVENLAGLKLVLAYDSTYLQFRKERKPPVAQSLMHIVNPKIQGKLIVVMAGAKGIKVKNGAIIYLTFKVSSKIPASKKIPIKIEEVELMTDQLKKLNPTIKDGEVVLVEKTAPKSIQKK